ncbi:cytochrome c, class I [Longibacter salinarum]|uniref:Cytochrome c, class I n=1 Tax=Longibacter salinarum TaxID=1850348 RepID=A0A2A8D1M9_9BACT|nr:c-type cytochrome [Longibacter salinarum]PEN14816.1 cytochrome c, class I [Longibacter salinarum]
MPTLDFSWTHTGLLAAVAILVTAIGMTPNGPVTTEQPIGPREISSNRFVHVVNVAVLPPKTGRELYMDACAACHGADGTGVPQSQVGFDVPLPDFTSCTFATREPDADWIAVAHQGGPVRGFSPMMPAFGDALTRVELAKIMTYIRSMCDDGDWPRGELNLPRPLVTEKAYPEDEAVFSTSIDVENEGAVVNEIVYESRFGARNQLEVVIPFGYRERPDGNWTGGHLGDIAVGVKRALFHSLDSGSILSVTGEVLFPTGADDLGFGSGTTVFEPFVSYGQLLPAGSFFHAQGGSELPLDQDKAENEAFFRGALGKSFSIQPWGRTWSPMVEVLGSRALESGAETHWDIAPQVQVTLNTRQHVRLNVGAQIPLDDAGRDTRIAVYLLWDWFDGGFFEGW